MPLGAWAEPVDAVPKFTGRIHGRGGDLVRFAGLGSPGGPAVLRHRGRGDVRLLALDDDLAEWAEPARGKGDADLPFRLPRARRLPGEGPRQLGHRGRGGGRGPGGGSRARGVREGHTPVSRPGPGGTRIAACAPQAELVVSGT
ncbi:hypothetical protein [Streptomyces sp. NPDC004546]|uniref:hypothetical protein n=1 Tax=Streptomyces sp. NPDC004546 TaxID=3154282 RepID=UPI0033A0DD2A